MEDLTGKQFGSYQIVAPLGEGGMAAVCSIRELSQARVDLMAAQAPETIPALFDSFTLDNPE